MKTLCCVLFVISAGSLLQGCSYPEPAKVEQKDTRPSIGISGAPENSVLVVDGLDMGLAAAYDGIGGVLLIESGKHLIELKAANGKVLHSEELFLSSSTTKIIKYTP